VGIFLLIKDDVGLHAERYICILWQPSDRRYSDTD